VLDALITAYRLATEYGGAVQAAQAVFKAKGTAFQAIDAFAAATEGAADDKLVAELKDLVRKAIGYTDQAVSILKAGVDKSDDVGAFLVKVSLRLKALGAEEER
jgi:hypothetical protein